MHARGQSSGGGARSASATATVTGPAVRRPTTDCQVDCQRCGQGGSAWTRTSGGLWGPVRRRLLGGFRLGRWPILARAPGEDGPNLRRTTPKSPVRAAGGRTRLLPADWAPGGHQRPEELPRPSRVSLERVSFLTTRRPREPHRRNGGWRHPPPSGSPSGPVSPSGRNSNPDFPVQPRRPLGAQRNLEGAKVAVKARVPLARRVCPASSR
jgi:hypothetical protein